MTHKGNVYLAVDLGAESGAWSWPFDGANLARPLHRFPNGPVSVRGTLYWDVLRLWSDIKDWPEKAANSMVAVSSASASIRGASTTACWPAMKPPE